MNTVRTFTVLTAAILVAGGCARGVRSQNASLKVENSKLTTDLESSESARKATNQELENVNKQLSESQKQAASWKKDLDGVRKALMAAQSKQKETADQLAEAQTLADSSAKALAESQSDAASLREQLDLANNNLQAMKSAAEKSAAEVAQLKKQVFELSAKMNESAKPSQPGLPQQGVKVQSSARPGAPRTAGVNPNK